MTEKATVSIKEAFQKYNVNPNMLLSWFESVDRQKDEYWRAKDDFLALLSDSLIKLDFTKAVYKLLDELSAYNKDWRLSRYPCQRGCSYCCHPVVNCTRSEIEAIYKYLESLKRDIRRPIKLQVRQDLSWFLEYYEWQKKKYPEIQRADKNREINPAFIELVKKNDHGQCPFLTKMYSVKNNCAVYPMRPLTCRLTKSNRGCSKNYRNYRDTPGFMYEYIAADLLTEESQKRGNGGPVTLPLSFWLKQQYNSYFSKKN